MANKTFPSGTLFIFLFFVAFSLLLSHSYLSAASPVPKLDGMVTPRIASKSDGHGMEATPNRNKMRRGREKRSHEDDSEAAKMTPNPLGTSYDRTTNSDGMVTDRSSSQSDEQAMGAAVRGSRFRRGGDSSGDGNDDAAAQVTATPLQVPLTKSE